MAAQEEGKLNQKTILLVEDDPLLVKMYTTKFKVEGYNLISARDGEEGLKLALQGNADLIMLDIMMPKLSGIDLLTKLKQAPKEKHIPILILSNLTQEEEVQKALSLGASEYIVKANLTPAQVVAKVKKYIG